MSARLLMEHDGAALLPIGKAIYLAQMEQSDAELLDAWGSGDVRAGNRLFNRYLLPVSRFFVKKVPADHEDLVQDTFMACLHGRERLRDKDRFRAFLFGVASNVLRMYLRRLRLHQPPARLDEHRAHDLAPGPGSPMRPRPDEQVLLDALRRLPLPLQTVVALYYWEGMRTHEIARAVGLPIGTVRSHLRRGRRQLAQLLDDRPDQERWRDA